MGLCNKIARYSRTLIICCQMYWNQQIMNYLKSPKSNSVTGMREKNILLDGLIHQVIVPYSVLSLFLFLFGCAMLHPFAGTEITNRKDTIHDSKDLKSIGSISLSHHGSICHLLPRSCTSDLLLILHVSYAESMGFNLQEARSSPVLHCRVLLSIYF